MPRKSSKCRTRREFILRKRKIEQVIQQNAETSIDDLRAVLKGTSSVNTARDPSSRPSTTQLESPNPQFPTAESVEDRFPTLSKTAEVLRTANHSKKRRRKRWGGPRSMPSCVFHPKDNGHKVDQCPKLLKEPVAIRLELLREIRCCESCAGLHSTLECRVLSECEVCAGDHITILRVGH